MKVATCPFCGDDVGFAGMTPDAFCKSTGTFAIGCPCGATGPLVPTMEEAVEAWNRRVKRTQWFKRGDHPAVRHPKEPHLQPVYGIRKCGFLQTPNGEMLIREGDWIIENESGVLSLEVASEDDLARLP